MNTPRRRLWFALTSAAFCVACAGSNFEWDKARQVRTGMTEDEVSALLGPPTDVRPQFYGMTWTWTYLNPREGGSRGVSVAFRDGRVVYGTGVPESFK